MGEQRSTTSDRIRTACSGERPAVVPFQPSAAAVARWSLIAASGSTLPSQPR